MFPDQSPTIVPITIPLNIPFFTSNTVSLEFFIVPFSASNSIVPSLLVTLPISVAKLFSDDRIFRVPSGV